MKAKVLIAVGAIVAVGVGAFAFGLSRDHTSTTTSKLATTPAGNGNSAGRPVTAGTLDGVKGKTLTITGASGQQVTVKTSSSTAVTKMESGSVSDLKDGDLVVATGSDDGTGALTASSLTDQGANTAAGQNGGSGRFRSGGGGGGFGGSGAAGSAVVGRIAGIDGDTITLNTLAGGTTRVIVAPGTTAISVFRSVPLSQLTTGQNVVVRGSTESNGVVDATSVQQGGRGGFGGGRRGGGTPATAPA